MLQPNKWNPKPTAHTTGLSRSMDREATGAFGSVTEIGFGF